MLIKKGNKLSLVWFVTLAVIGLCAVTYGKASAAPTPVLTIGIVDYAYLIDNNPDTAKANEALRLEQEIARREYTEKSAILNEKGKKDLETLLNQRVEQKRLELLKPITDKINATIKTVAESKGLTVVFYKNTVAFGGVDITKEVADKLNKN